MFIKFENYWVEKWEYSREKNDKVFRFMVIFNIVDIFVYIYFNK